MSNIDKKALLASFEEELAGVLQEREKLTKRQSALEKAVSGLRELISLNGGGRPAVPFGPTEQIVPKNAFAKLEIVEGAVALLRLMKKGLTNRQVLEGLLAGGYKTKAKRFPNTVRSVLNRDSRKPGSLLTRNGDLWELKEWFHAEDDEEIIRKNTEQKVRELFG